MELWTKEQKTLYNRAVQISEHFDKKIKMFSKGMFILTLFDVIFGVLAISLTSLQLTAFFMSAASLTTITVCGRVIQLTKIQSLNKSLRLLQWSSIAWFVNKYKNKKIGGNVKKTTFTTLQKILTALIAIFGVGGVVVGILPQFTNIATEITNWILIASESLAVLSGLILSQTSDHVLTEEELKAQEENAKAKELALAEKKVAEYENAKKLLDEANQSKDL